MPSSILNFVFSPTAFLAIFSPVEFPSSTYEVTLLASYIPSLSPSERTIAVPLFILVAAYTVSAPTPTNIDVTSA